VSIAVIDEVFEPIIFSELSFEEKLFNPYWFVTFGDDSRAYSKLNRRSWLELKSWLSINPDARIKALHFQFRDNCIEIGREAEGYFFSHNVQQFIGQSPQYAFVGGVVKDGYMKSKKFMVPELVYKVDGDEEFPIDHPEISMGLCMRGLANNVKEDLSK
jgi:hypothetical protein